MDAGEVRYKITGDNSDFKSSVKDSEKAAEKSANNIKKISDSLGKIPETTAKIDNAYTDVIKGVAELNAAISKNSGELREVDAVMREAGETASLTAQRDKLLADVIESLNGKLLKMTSYQEEVRKTMERGEISAEQYRAYEREIESTRAALIKMESQIKSTSDVVQSETEQMTEEQQSFKNSVDDTGKSAVSLGDIIKGNMISDAVMSGLRNLCSILKEAAGAAAEFAKEGIGLASDLSEVQNVVDVTFGDNNNKIYDFADTCAEKFGLARLSAEKYAGTMGALLKSSGITEGLEDMSTSITGLAGDMASFYNLDTDTAFEKLRSGISGETEPLKQLGINMSVVNMEAFALSQGIDKSWESMSQAEQTLLRYKYIMAQTADAQGDFARTSDSMANQQRLLQLNIQSVKAEMGEELLPAAQDFVSMLNDNMPAIKDAAAYFGGELADSLETLAGNAEEFVQSGGLERTVDTLKWVVDNGDKIITVGAGIMAVINAKKITDSATAFGSIVTELKKFTGMSSELNTVASAATGAGTAISGASASVSAAAVAFNKVAVAMMAATVAAEAIKGVTVDKWQAELKAHEDNINAITDETLAINDEARAYRELTDSQSEAFNPTEARERAIEELDKYSERRAELEQEISELGLKVSKGVSVDENGKVTYYSDTELARMEQSLNAARAELEAIDALQHQKLQIINKWGDEELNAYEQQSRAQEQAQTNAGKTNEQAIAEVWAKIRETTKSEMDKYDNELATHKIDDSQYWAKRKAYLEAHRDSESAEWWAYYDEVQAHYRKLSETERTEAETYAKESESNLKNAVQEKFRDLETEQLENGYDDSWLLEQERAFIETLDHNSDVYKEYNLKLLQEQKKSDEAAENEVKDTAEKQKNALEKAYESVVKSRDSLVDSMALGGDIFQSSEETDKRTGEKSKNRSINIEDFEKKIAAKKKLTSKIAELLEKNTPDEIISQLLKADPEDALYYANELLRSPDKLSRLSKGFENDEAYSNIIANMVTEKSEDFSALGTEAGNLFGESFMAAFRENWETAFDGVFDDEYTVNASAQVKAANASAANESTYVRRDYAAEMSENSTSGKKRAFEPQQSDVNVRVLNVNGTWLADAVKKASDQKAIRGGG